MKVTMPAEVLASNAQGEMGGNLASVNAEINFPACGKVKFPTGLQWAQVDLTRRVAWFHADQTKNKKTSAVPLNADAVQILRR